MIGNVFASHRFNLMLWGVNSSLDEPADDPQLTAKRKAFQEPMLLAMKSASVSALILPATAICAGLRGYGMSLLPIFSYIAIANALQMPSGGVLVTSVRRNTQENLSQWLEPLQDVYDERAAAITRNCAGLPVSVQVMAPPRDDEICLGVMRDVEGDVGFRCVPPSLELFHSWEGPLSAASRSNRMTCFLAAEEHS